MVSRFPERVKERKVSHRSGPSTGCGNASHYTRFLLSASFTGVTGARDNLFCHFQKDASQRLPGWYLSVVRWREAEEGGRGKKGGEDWRKRRVPGRSRHNGAKSPSSFQNGSQGDFPTAGGRSPRNVIGSGFGLLCPPGRRNRGQQPPRSSAAEHWAGPGVPARPLLPPSLGPVPPGTNSAAGQVGVSSPGKVSARQVGPEPAWPRVPPGRTGTRRPLRPPRFPRRGT